MKRSRRNTRPAELQLTQRALADLKEIERYSVQEWGRKTAGKYLDDIAAALDRLVENPQLLKLEPEFSPNLFFFRVRKHFLVCDCQGDSIIVLTVIHTSMDLPARLQELEPRLALEAQIMTAKLGTPPNPS